MCLIAADTDSGLRPCCPRAAPGVSRRRPSERGLVCVARCGGTPGVVPGRLLGEAPAEPVSGPGVGLRLLQFAQPGVQAGKAELADGGDVVGPKERIVVAHEAVGASAIGASSGPPSLLRPLASAIVSAAPSTRTDRGVDDHLPLAASVGLAQPHGLASD